MIFRHPNCHHTYPKTESLGPLDQRTHELWYPTAAIAFPSYLFYAATGSQYHRLGNKPDLFVSHNLDYRPHLSKNRQPRVLARILSHNSYSYPVTLLVLHPLNRSLLFYANTANLATCSRGRRLQYGRYGRIFCKALRRIWHELASGLP